MLISLAKLKILMTKHSNAIEYFKKSYLHFINSGDTVSAAYELCNIGEIYYDEGNINESLKYFEDAVKHMKELEDKRHSAIQLQSMADIYFKIKQIDLAKKYCKESLDILQSLGNDRDIKNALKKMDRYTK